MRIRQQRQFQYGYNSITEMDGNYPDMLMDFGILKLDMGQEITSREGKERAFLLITGEVEFEWDGHGAVAKRASCFDEMPWCLHVPSDVPIMISCLKQGTELSVHKTINAQRFEARLFKPEDCHNEERGIPSLKDTATRIVRTIIDKSNRKNSNLVLGETINFPGRWSGYPPHHHPQPEIYFYKFNLENGFGYAEVGEQVYKLRTNDTLLIYPGVTHPQVSAPGYAMCYIWAIRHLDNLPYIAPIFAPEYMWVTDNNIPIWPDN